MASARTVLRPTKQPVTPIEFLVSSVRDYLYLPDPGGLYVLMGAVAANLLEGSPCWLMLVGPSSGGKTALINSLLDVPGIHELANISGEASFLSGTAQKDKAKDATGGILRMVGDHGGVLLNDFTSVLSLSQDILKRVLTVFRESYSGRWTRSIGSEGGRSMQWTGKVMFIAGCTGEIDQHHQVSASLGERWIYYRLDRIDGFAQSKRALLNSARHNWEEDLRSLVHAFFTALDLNFGNITPRRELTDAEMIRIICMAGVAARCRSAVTRDTYSATKDIVAVPEQEVESRLATSLGQLYIGMDYIGVPDAEKWRLVGKVALDSMPRLRRVVVDAAAESGGATLAELRELTGCSKSVVNRVVEELEIFGILGKTRVTGLSEDGSRVRVEVSEWMRAELRKGWRK